MYLFILGGSVIVCCLIYIFFADHPEYFVGKKTKQQGKDIGSKVIYLPQSPDALEAEKARRSRRKR